MKIKDIIMEVRGAMTDGYHVLTEEDYAKYSKDSMSFTEFSDYMESHGLPMDNLWVINRRAMFNLYYAVPDKGLYADFFINKGHLEQTIGTAGTFIEHLANAIKKENSLLLEQDYSTYYTMSVPDTFKVYDFEYRYKDIPEDSVFEVWRLVHEFLDYSYGLWNRDILRYVFSKAPIAKNPDKEIVIYRGIGEESQDVDTAFSWTTKLSVATWFACKHGTGISVAKAVVKCGDVIVLDDSHECEVIYQPDNPRKVEYLPYLPATDAMMYTLLRDIKQVYRKVSRQYLKPLTEWYYGGDHDIRHIARVVILTQIYCHHSKDEVSSNDKAVLLYAALLHDIGRDNDGEDDSHGRKSLDFIEENDITLSGLTTVRKGHSKFIADFLIEYHCRDDRVGEKAITTLAPYSNWTKSQQEHVLHLYRIFKDMDGLDRVRLRDFDPEYLRTDFAKKLPFIAAKLQKSDVLEYVS